MANSPVKLPRKSPEDPLELTPGGKGTSTTEMFEGETLALLNGKLQVADSFIRLLNHECSFNEFIREILLTIIKVIPSEAGSILEVSDERRILFFRASIGSRSSELMRFEVPIGKGIAGFVAERMQPLLVPHMSENKIALKSIQNAIGFEPRNLIAAPIVIRGKTFGVIELLNRQGESTFTSMDLELLNYFAALAAQIIEVRLVIAWYAHHSSTSEVDSDSGSNQQGNAA